MDNGRKKKIEHVEEMPVYEAFFNLALQVEQETRRYASDFRWLRDQSLRSSESVCANMTEGFYSQYSTEYLQALYRSRREARETITHLRYATGVGQLPDQTDEKLVMKYLEALKQLANLIGSIERKINERGKSKPSLK
jgi:four helix bundle protein